MAKQRAVAVLVVGADPLSAESLAAALGLQRGVTAAAATAPDGLEDATPAVVVVDLDHVDGSEVVRKAVRRWPESVPVAIAGSATDLVRAAAVEAGAAGVISKEAGLDALRDAVRLAAAGGWRMPEEERRRLLRALRHRRAEHAAESQRAERLTARELQVLQLMADGLSIPEIAGGLGIRHPTVRTHVQNVLMKLGVHSKTQALALAIRHGKVEPRR